MGPCRLPLPKGGIEGEDTRKGLCGATANTIAARNFMPHGRRRRGRSLRPRPLCGRGLHVRGPQRDRCLQNQRPQKLLAVAPFLGVATTVEVDGEVKDRDIDEIALEVAEKALNEWGKAEGELLYLKRAPAATLREMEKIWRAAAQHRP
jgi:carbon-monoxide dehydrogenase catalytic subunit